MPDDLLNLDSDLKPDLNHLEWECQRQGQLYMDYARVLVAAQEELEDCKTALAVAKTDFETAKALLEIDIRHKPMEYNPPLKKNGEPDIKEDWFKAMVALNIDKDARTKCKKDELAALSTRLVEANRRVSLCDHALKAIGGQRKMAIEKAAELWQRGYWTTPWVAPLPECPTPPEKPEAQRAADGTDKQRQGLTRRRKAAE